jgi:hypothetical protein
LTAFKNYFVKNSNILNENTFYTLQTYKNNVNKGITFLSDYSKRVRKYNTKKTHIGLLKQLFIDKIVRSPESGL